jgi:hypothetical protein
MNMAALLDKKFKLVFGHPQILADMLSMFPELAPEGLRNELKETEDLPAGWRGALLSSSFLEADIMNSIVETIIPFFELVDTELGNMSTGKTKPFPKRHPMHPPAISLMDAFSGYKAEFISFSYDDNMWVGGQKLLHSLEEKCAKGYEINDELEYFSDRYEDTWDESLWELGTTIRQASQLQSINEEFLVHWKIQVDRYMAMKHMVNKQSAREDGMSVPDLVPEL